MIITNGYIIATTHNDEQYNVIMQKIQNKPSTQNGYECKLRADNLEWDLLKLPEPVEDEANTEDYEQALQQMGVDFSD